MKFDSLKFLVLTLCLAVSNPGGAAQLLSLSWDDLMADGKSFDDPYETLDNDQFLLFTDVLLARELLDAGEKVDDALMASYESSVAQLESQGIDVEDLYRRSQLMTSKITDKTLMTNPQLDGKLVSMPGYMLPLEFDGIRVTEFLLVPYVGACIHTPPPPPNQVVHVKSRKGFESPGRLFAPVRVDGLMQIQGGKVSTRLIDGSTLVYSSYTIEANSVIDYRY